MKNSLRVLRAERNRSQADQLAVSHQTVNALETGKYDPGLPLAFGMARLFDRMIEEILDPEKIRDRRRDPSSPHLRMTGSIGRCPA